MAYQPIANYEKEQAFFNEFIRRDEEPNILLFQGESGSGKSYLIEHCLGSVSEMPSLLLKLQPGGDSIPTLFTNMGRRRGWDHLPYFTHAVASLLEMPGNAADPVWRMGMHRHLREIGKVGDLESRLTRYHILSDAWFADSMKFDTPFLLAVDTYENGSTLV